MSDVCCAAAVTSAGLDVSCATTSAVAWIVSAEMETSSPPAALLEELPSDDCTVERRFSLTAEIAACDGRREKRQPPDPHVGFACMIDPSGT